MWRQHEVSMMLRQHEVFIFFVDFQQLPLKNSQEYFQSQENEKADEMQTSSNKIFLVSVFTALI